MTYSYVKFGQGLDASETKFARIHKMSLRLTTMLALIIFQVKKWVALEAPSSSKAAD